MGHKISGIDADAFSSGQIASKIWLCEELEKLFDHIDEVWIYGGWYGVTAFLLKSRNNISITKIKSYDADPSCESIADLINENWVWQNWSFKSYTQDCNQIFPEQNKPDLIINTSTEHFQSLNWYNNIPKGTVVVLQSNNMPHADHFNVCSSLEDFQLRYPVTHTFYIGQKDFVYPEWNFSRFMLIGTK